MSITTNPIINGDEGLTSAQIEAINDGNLVDANGNVFTLSEMVEVVTVTSSGTQALAGPSLFRGFVVRACSPAATVDVTIYDALSATGTAIMTVSNINTGTYYWDGDWVTPGVGTGGRRVNSTGCWIVFSGGTATLDIMVE